jgi:hypothetical protein
VIGPVHFIEPMNGVEAKMLDGLVRGNCVLSIWALQALRASTNMVARVRLRDFPDWV